MTDQSTGDVAVARSQTIQINVTVDVSADLMAILNRLAGLTPRSPAVRAVLKLGEKPMPASISVDTTNEIVTVGFVDDHGDTDAAAPAGVVATFTSDNPAALTVAPDPTNALQGDLTPVAEGTANVGVTLANADGSPLLEADGTTPWAPVDAVAVTVTPGAAVGARLTVTP